MTQYFKCKIKVNSIYIHLVFDCWCIIALLISSIAIASEIGGSLTGEIKDTTGAAITNAVIILTDPNTGVSLKLVTNQSGSYYFTSIPVGNYDLSVTASGFRAYRRSSITVSVTGVARVDAVLQVGENQDAVMVVGTSVSLDTDSTQMGEVMVSSTINTLPLNGRSYSDLLALQAGVAPITTMTSATVQGLGQSVFSPSGDLNPGALSINGQRESANEYIVNGANAEENGSMAAAIIPNLDSIAEFRILINNMDAEFGRYSGGQINVVTKSGTNKVHGNGFEFFRNTNLDAKNYFSTDRGTFEQNQFGATLGGPVLRDKVFFFFDYQGTRQTQGVDTGRISVPNAAQRSGNFYDPKHQANTLTGDVSGPYLASLLSQRLDVTVYSGEPYTEVFPTGVIPSCAWSAPAKALLQYIPASGSTDGIFSTSAYNQRLHDNKSAARVDANTHWGRVSVYYALDNYVLDNPYPTAQGGGNIPGFNALSMGRSQLIDFEHDKTIGDYASNQTHVSYTRVANDMGRPVGGMGVSLESQGFVTGSGTLGIVAGQPDNEGVENVVFSNFTIGSDPNQYRQINNTYEVTDDLSKSWNTHTFKIGFHADYDQINTYPYAQLNGSFQFYGNETGVDFADFLLGTPSQYNQNGLRPFYERETYWGIYAQDSWRVLPNLTINAGLRWDRIEPWWEKNNNSMTLVPGVQSVAFPTAPLGLVFPGDPGIARTLAAAQNRNFAPRVGVAYTPFSTQDSLLGRFIGVAGTTSIHAGFGIFYTGVPGESLGLISDNAPYGFTYTSPAPPLFTTPFMDAATGHSEGQRFPAALAPLNVSRSNPDANIDWAQFEPISAVPGYSPTNKTAYTEEYMLSWQRQIGPKTLISLTYAGNQAHRLLVLKAANPGNAAACLALSQPSEVAANSTTCGPFGESTTYTTASGETVNGVREPLGPAFGSVSNQSAIGNSTYNSLKINLRHTSKWVELLAGYTYSKSIDQASNFGDQVNPIDPRLSRGLASFDMRQNFVVSYTVPLSFAHSFHASDRWGNGWELCGITHLSTGFPVTLTNYGDTSLWGTQSNGVNNIPVDEPSYQRGPLALNRNPRNGQPYFNTTLFSLPAVGDPGNARRRFFSSPGMDNYDISLQKSLNFTESTTLKMRAEGFNVFNHAQFCGPKAVNGNITDTNIINTNGFGQVVSAAAPRLIQVAVEFVF
jgi:hypothetical protein